MKANNATGKSINILLLIIFIVTGCKKIPEPTVGYEDSRGASLILVYYNGTERRNLTERYLYKESINADHNRIKIVDKLIHPVSGRETTFRYGEDNKIIGYQILQPVSNDQPVYSKQMSGVFYDGRGRIKQRKDTLLNENDEISSMNQTDVTYRDTMVINSGAVFISAITKRVPQNVEIQRNLYLIDTTRNIVITEWLLYSDNSRYYKTDYEYDPHGSVFVYQAPHSRWHCNLYGYHLAQPSYQLPRATHIQVFEGTRLVTENHEVHGVNGDYLVFAENAEVIISYKKNSRLKFEYVYETLDGQIIGE